MNRSCGRPAYRKDQIVAKTITFDQIEARFHLAGYYFGAMWCPAIALNRASGVYSIRVLPAGLEPGTNLDHFARYDYFRIDRDGMVIASPRGSGPEFDRRVRVVGLAEALQRHAVPAADLPAATPESKVQHAEPALR
jgi:hypothetical protein